MMGSGMMMTGTRVTTAAKLGCGLACYATAARTTSTTWMRTATMMLRFTSGLRLKQMRQTPTAAKQQAQTLCSIQPPSLPQVPRILNAHMAIVASNWHCDTANQPRFSPSLTKHCTLTKPLLACSRARLFLLRSPTSCSTPALKCSAHLCSVRFFFGGGVLVCLCLCVIVCVCVRLCLCVHAFHAHSFACVVVEQSFALFVILLGTMCSLCALNDLCLCSLFFSSPSASCLTHAFVSTMQCTACSEA